MRHKFTWLLSVCLFVCSLQLFAQTPKLSADINAGCAPVSQVKFTNNSTGFSASATYTINFGDGSNNFSIAVNGTATRSYSLPNTYIATLTVTDGGAPVRDTEVIAVYKNPVADFSVNMPKVCANSSINFSSISVPGDGNIVVYKWDFGDGYILDTSSPNVQHQYSSARNPNINVTLNVTDNYGCTNSVAKNAITILPAPKVSFTVSQTTLCSVEDPVTFTNETTGGALPTTYLWSFGDGNSSTDANPVYTYSNKGAYVARLLATSADGCTDTSKLTTITVASSKSGITLPTLLCLNADLTFLDSSFPRTNTPVWMLDGVVVGSNIHQYQTIFTDTKQHTLQLINNYGACTDTATKIIQAQEAPVPSPFSVNIVGTCSVPVSATFKDAGAGSAKWEWDFDNVNPAVFKPTAFVNNAPHVYTTENTYFVMLRVTDASGCTGEIRQPVIIKKNTTTITSSEGAYGCKTLSTTFKANSNNPVASYQWSFSDDNSTSVLDTPRHVFVNMGKYVVKLKLKTTGGCNDSASYKVQIGNEPSFDFELTTPSDTEVCGNKLIYFNVTGDTDKIVGQYYWNFGDVNKFSLLPGPTFSHRYAMDSVYNISLAINNHGCNDTITKTAFLKVLPPFPDVTVAVNSCDDRLKVVFKEVSKKAQTYSWNFGDGSPTYLYDSAHRDTAVTHYYSKTGSFKTVLTTTNGSCTVKDSLYARVLTNQVPTLSTSQVNICASDSFKTTVSNLQFNPYGSTLKYTIKAIEYENGLPFTGSYSVPAVIPVVPFQTNITGLASGDQKIRIITNSNTFNCPDTTNYIPVQINGPQAGFNVTNNKFCLSDKMILNDTSTQSGTTPITSWHWFFGDSTDQELTSGGSIFHKYIDPGNYIVKLVVTDAMNCADTAFYSDSSLNILGPKARFGIAQNPILPNTPEEFTNLTDSGYSTRANNSYDWDFGDGASSTSNADQLPHIYKLYAFDTVKLIATSSITGCSDTATSVVQVKNTKLKFSYSLDDPNATCPPLQINFKNESENFSVVSWDFGNGKTADNFNTPSTIYGKPGTYKVTVFGYFDDNTYDSTEEYIIVKGPTATLHADVVPGCGSKQVFFTAETQSTTSLSWDFQDGTSSSDSIINHTYTTPNIYTPVLTVKNGPGCVFSYPLTTPIAIDSMHVDINKDSVIQCHQLLVNFRPTIFSIAKNNNQQVDYKWDFGDGVNTSQADTTAFTYTKPGTYAVTFIATSLYGCTDTTTTQIDYTDVFPVTIQASAPEFCEGTQQVFTAVKSNNNDVLTYDWKFENGTSTVQTPPAQIFTAAWKDSVRLIVDKNNCRDTLYYKPIVHGIPNITIGLSDSISCLGKTVLFTANNTATLPESIDYVWNFGGGNTDTKQATSHLYTIPGKYPVSLTATSAFGCKKVVSDTVLINPTPIASIQVLQDVCAGSIVSFKGLSNIAPVQYEWHFVDGTTSTQQNPVKTYTSGTTDNLYLVVKAGNCSDTANETITVHNLPQANITSSSSRVCFGDSAHITAHNGQSYQWLNATYITNALVADPYVFPPTDTKYAVQVTDAYGCKNIDSFLVTVTQPQKITVISPVNVCVGNKAQLFASGTDSYKWIDSAYLTSASISNPYTKDSATNKTFTVIGSDAYSCFTDQATVEVIVRQKPVVDAGQPIQMIVAGQSIQLAATSDDNNVTWKWTPPTYLSCSDCSSPVGKLRESVTYNVEATSSYGCTGSDTVHVTVVCKESLVNVPQIFSPNGDGRNDKFHIVAQGLKTIRHIVIYSRNGNKVFERNNVSPYGNDASWDGMYNHQYMPTGTYIYMIEAQCDAGEIYNLQGTVTLVR